MTTQSLGVTVVDSRASADKQRPSTWTHTRAGEKRGYIDSHTLKELWFHTGTACNLACPFCLEGSKPGDTRLGLVKLDEIKPFVDEALELGVEQFSFTGGEPFVAKDFVNILHYASSHRPCLVLTNGTEALTHRLSQVETLRDSAFPISFRISLDYPDAAKHDAGRGEGSFAAALEGIRALRELGFSVSVARQSTPDEDSESVDQVFRSLVGDETSDKPLNIIAFPDFGVPFSQLETPEITESCMTTYHTEAGRKEFMCAYSRMVVKHQGKMRVYACTLVDDDLSYDLGGSLHESLEDRVMLGHHRCYSCFAFGASCSEG